MRLRIDPVAARLAKILGHRLDRSPSQVAALALASFAKTHLNMTPANQSASPDEVFLTSKSIVVFRAGRELRAAVEKFAKTERRSLGSAVRVLLIDALKTRGLLDNESGPLVEPAADPLPA